MSTLIQEARNRAPRALSLGALLIFPALALQPAAGSARKSLTGNPGPSTQRKAPRPGVFGKVPLHFEPNQGQAHPEVQFTARGRGYRLFLTESEAVLALKPAAPRDGACGGCPRAAAAPAAPAAPSVLRLQIAGGRPAARAHGEQRLAGRSNYCFGEDRGRWTLGVPHFGRVKYDGVYPGVDLVYYGKEGQLEYDFVVKPGADPAPIRMRVVGARSAAVNGQGGLLLETDSGPVVQQAPVAYQEIRGRRVPVRAEYALRRAGDTASPVYEVAFHLGRYDRSRTLVIDPVLLYSTYLGGTEDDEGRAIAVHTDGTVVVAGTTESTNFPVRNQVKNWTGTWYDAFVTRLNAAGNGILYSTYLGSDNWDEGNDVALDTDGNAYVGGQWSFTDAYVVKLTPTGQVVFSAHWGGSGSEKVNSLALDGQRNIYVTGRTESRDLPVSANAVQRTKAEGLGSDAFVAKLNAAGSGLLYSTYLGSAGLFGDEGYAIAVDPDFNAYVGGQVGGTGFPTTANAFDRTYGGYTGDGFVSVLNPSASALLYSTYLGGTDYDSVRGLALDATRKVYVTGIGTLDFPTTTGAFQREWAAGDCDPSPTGVSACPDAIVAKLNPAATGAASLVYSSYLGGNYRDYGYDIVVDPNGNATLAGYTMGVNYPLVNPIPRATGTGVAVATVNATGTALLFSSTFGGSSDDQALGLARDALGNLYLTGKTYSTDFPLRGAIQGVNKGGQDAFIVKLGESPDNTPPTVTIRAPAAGSAHIALAQATGTASDPSGVLEVYGVLLRLNAAGDAVDGFWNWVSGAWDTQITIQCYRRAAGTTSWSVPLPALAPGRYEFYAGAVDGSPAYNENPEYVGNGFTILAQVSGRVTTPAGAALPGVTVRRTGSTAGVLTDANGSYTLKGLAAGTYTVTPSLNGYYFTPASRTVTISGSSIADVNFTATADSTPPTAAVTTPAAAPKNAYRSLGTAAGTARDAGGIRGVTVALVRYADAASTTPIEWYNWQTRLWVTAAGAGTERPATGTTSWSVGLPGLTNGYYGVRATATDSAGNTGASAFARYVIDTTVPTVTVTRPAPAPGNVYPSLTSAAGTAADTGSGLQSVTLALVRYAGPTATTPNGWWDWTAGAWVAAPTAATEKVATGTTSWAVTLPALAAGDYAVRATAKDRAGNTRVGGFARFRIQ